MDSRLRRNDELWHFLSETGINKSVLPQENQSRVFLDYAKQARFAHNVALFFHFFYQRTHVYANPVQDQDENYFTA